jgi:hypothetical protein
MKIVITESQYKVIKEQYWTKSQMDAMSKVDPHTLMTVIGIASAFIPVAGPFISAGIGLIDSAIYYNEGDKKSAGLVGALSMLPFVGKVVSKIPGVKELGSKGMALLASKLSSGTKLTNLETQVVNAISSSKDLITQELNVASTKLKPVLETVKSMRLPYIERFGQDSYENLLREFLSGKSESQYFMQSLKSAQKASPNLANFVTKFGIKFTKDEISQIQKVARELMEVNTGTNIILNTKAGPKTIKVHMLSKNLVQKYFPASVEANMMADVAGGNIFMVKDNIIKLSPKQIEDVLTHEFAHIKDPSMVASPKYIKKYSTEAVQGVKDWVEAQQWKSLGADEIAAKKWNSAIKKYYLNPNEIIANNSMVLQSFATNTKNLGNVMNKNQILKGLDDVINFAKGNSSDLSKDAFKLLGYYDTNISNHFQRIGTNPVEYRKFLSKIAQQANYLKSQVKIAM